MLLQNLSGPGLDADIALPPLETLHAHDTFELDFELSCPGDRDRDCPIWDHTVQLFVCCDDPSGHAAPCESCDPTLWVDPYTSSASHDGGNSAGSAKMLWQPSSSSAASLALPQCGRELGRWITPFRSHPRALHAMPSMLDCLGFNALSCSVFECYCDSKQQQLTRTSNSELQ